MFPPLPYQADMLALDADAPKPPAYPFIIYSFKEPSADKQNEAR